MSKAGLLLAIALISSACGPFATADTTGPATTPGPESAVATDDPPAPSDAVVARVDFVQDGDSLRVTIGGQEERIRLIGINTPERDECFGSEARDILDGLIANQEILVATDVEAFDQYGRILGYVWYGDTFINAEVVRTGAALARAFEPNTSLQEHLDAAERFAQTNQLGMWSPSACGPAGDYDIVITEVHADAAGRDDEHRNGEWIVIDHQGATEIDLSEWTIKDESSVHRYVFEQGITMQPGESFVIYTGCGNDQPPEFYWCDDTPVWDNAGDTAFVLDSNGSIVDQFSY